MWGLKPKVLGLAWLTGSLSQLHVTDEDLHGGGRLRATRLLRVPGYLPLLGGFEPYTDLLRRVENTVVDPRAAVEFAYDWRLPVVYNAAELVGRCEQHLQAWRGVVAAEGYCDPQDVRLVIVAHSMGGLLARVASAAAGMADALREIITLGTPYFSAVKAIRMFATSGRARQCRRAPRSDWR